MKKPIHRLFNLLKNYPREIRQIYGLAIFSGLINLSLPLGIQAIINFLQTGEFTISWALLVFFVLVGIGFSGTLQIFQLRIVEDILQDIFSKSAFEFSYRFPKIKNKALEKIYFPELANRFFDTLTIQKGLPKILMDFSLAVFQIVFGLILLAFYSSYFLILGFIFVFLLWLIFKITAPKGMSSSLKESKSKYKIAHWIEEIARVHKTFKTNQNQNYHIQRTDKINGEYLNARQKHFSVLLTQYNLFVAFKVIVAATLLIFGGMLVFQQVMNIGQFVAAEIMIIIIINSVEKMITLLDTIYDVLTALDKIGSVTDLELETDKGTFEIESSELNLSVKSLDFRFEFNDKKVIDNLSFTIENGEKVLLEGKSGGGRSTLLKLLAGILAPTKGQILINGIDVNNYKSACLRKNIKIILPVNQLFDGTIEENIYLGNQFKKTNFQEILERLYLKDFIYSLPKGLQTKIESTGQNLPRSAVQKIHLARLLVKNPRIVLLEDPLNFVNPQEKKAIIDYLMEQDFTMLVVGDNAYWQEKIVRKINLENQQNA